MIPLCIDTLLTPCSMEFCPSQPQLGTCGQYQTQQLDIQEAESSHKDPVEQTSDSDCPKIERLGKCILFETRLDDQKQTTSDSDIIPVISYEELQSIDCPAILDQRWTQDCEPILITADAAGDLNSYKFKKHVDHSSKPQLELISCLHQSKDQTSLCLAIDISDKKYRASRPKTVCSLSNGEIVLLDQDLDTSQLVETNRWVAHDFEPWTCGFDYWQSHTILTGGDDCKLKVWDSRSSLDAPVMVNKQFDGGVTAVRSHHMREHIFAVGSYDSGLRIYDKRNFKSEILKYNTGGGIWRIKWHESDYSQVLLATMHDGFKVISITEQQREEESNNAKGSKSGTDSEMKKIIVNPRVIATLKHRSGLAYGADWGSKLSFLNSNNTEQSHHLIGSCSFYDRVMHFWFAV